MKKLLFLLFLASPSMATTYYVSSSMGDDSNNGLSTITPFRTAPTMDCGSGWNGVTVQPGDTIVFKGGDVWIASTTVAVDCFGWNIPYNGTAGHPVTLKGDPLWFSGGSFVKPIFSCEYYCATALGFINSSYVNVDNIELRESQSVVPYGQGLITVYDSHDLHFSNLYVHGWRLTGAADHFDDFHGGFIGQHYANQATDIPTVSISDSEFENSENYGNQNGGAIFRVGPLTRVTIHDVHDAVLFSTDWNYGVQYNIAYPSGNLSPNWGLFHGNGVYMDPCTLGQSIGWIRNSIFYNVSGNGQMAYPNIRCDDTMYVYNNIFYGVISSQQPIEIDPFRYCQDGGGTPPCEGPGNAYIANNICYMQDSGLPTNICVNLADRSASPHGSDPPGDFVNNLTIANMHVIGPSGNTFIDNASAGNVHGTLTRLTNLPLQSASAAVIQGYDQAHLWAPQNANGATVHYGTDLSSVFTTDINGVNRGSMWDAGPYQFENSDPRIIKMKGGVKFR